MINQISVMFEPRELLSYHDSMNVVLDRLPLFLRVWEILQFISCQKRTVILNEILKPYPN
jgi:hypothetical protein